MIQKDTFMSLNILKKDCYSGSLKGMRYMLEKQGDTILATIWPEPLCYAKTPEELKQRKEFSFGEAGREAVVDWLNEQYETQKPLWRNAMP